MAYIFTSEYVGDENRRSAQVFKLTQLNGTGFAVKCFENNTEMSEHQFETETLADDFAEDWCQEYQPE